VATIVGDGTLGQGLLYESMNLASVWQAPLLVVVENNGIAQTTARMRPSVAASRRAAPPSACRHGGSQTTSQTSAPK